MASELIDQVLWWQGPDFLRNSTTNWPTIESYDLNQEAQMEMVKNITPITLSLVTNSSTFVCQSIKEVMDCKKYAGLNRLLRVTSYVIRFIKKCRKQTTSFDPFISPCEMNQSELLWIKSVQRSIFACEIQYLCSCVGQCPLLVKQFGLFLDDQEVYVVKVDSTIHLCVCSVRTQLYYHVMVIL